MNPNANRRDVDHKGRTLRRWDADGKLVEAVRSNSGLESQARMTDTPLLPNEWRDYLVSRSHKHWSHRKPKMQAP